MSCHNWKDSIALDAGGNLPPDEAAALARHLRDCPSCRREAEEMAASQAALRRFRAASRDEAGLERVRRGVLERLDGEAGRRRSRYRRRRAGRWLALAAGLVAAFSLWPFSLWQARGPEEMPPLERAAAPPAASPLEVAPSEVVVAEAPPLTSPPPSVSPPPPTRPGRRAFTLEIGKVPLASSSSLVVLPQKATPLPPIAPAAGMFIDVTRPSGRDTSPVLRRLTQRSDYTIYWLEQPPDPLKEKEDAFTKIL